MGATGIGVTDSIARLSQPYASSKDWEAESFGARFRRDAVTGNPAAVTELLPFSVTTLGLHGFLSKTASTLPAEIGNGELTGSVTANSYRHLGKNTTVWGHARFHAGKIKGVCWNNSADYDLVGPYVIGDPVGGDLTTRSYDFGGGYAGESEKWRWGVEASYRAAIDYRGRDPRDKIIVSDLDVSIGGGFRPAGSGLAIGLAGNVKVYNQTAAIEFYNPLNDIPTYAMTGLGSYYPRFSGNSGRNTAYSGAGFGLSVSLFPVSDNSGRPVRAQIEMSNLRLRQYMRDFNNLELTHTSTSSLAGEYGMMFGNLDERTSGICYGFTVRGHYNRKTGTENLVGSSTGNNYPIIGERENYRKTVAGASLTLPVELRLDPSNRIGLTLGGSYTSVSESLIEPFRKVSATNVTPSLCGEWSHRFTKGAILTIDAEVSRRFTTPGTITLTALDTASELGAAVMRDISLTTSDITAYGLSAKVEFPVVDSAALYLKAAWERRDFSRRCGSADYATLSVGINL